MGVRVRQALFLALGLVTATVMCLLGLWQMQRSLDSGAAGIQARANEAPVPLVDQLRPDGTVGDIYGKPVTVTGTYLPAEEILITGTDGAVRVLTAFQLGDGRVVPIVRGQLATAAVTPAVGGVRTETGLFLPGEGDSDANLPAGELGSVRMPLLAQKWPQRLVPGFVTLDASHAATHGLAQASVTLPKGEQSLTNGSYAIQWWIFAAFGLGMGIKLAHDAGARERHRLESDAAEAATVAAHGEPAERA